MQLSCSYNMDQELNQCLWFIPVQTTRQGDTRTPHVKKYVNGMSHTIQRPSISRHVVSCTLSPLAPAEITVSALLFKQVPSRYLLPSVVYHTSICCPTLEQLSLRGCGLTTTNSYPICHKTSDSTCSAKHQQSSHDHRVCIMHHIT